MSGDAGGVISEGYWCCAEVAAFFHVLHGAFASCAGKQIFAVSGGGGAGEVDEFFISQLAEHGFDESKRESELAPDASCCEAAGLEEKAHDDAFDDCG